MVVATQVAGRFKWCNEARRAQLRYASVILGYINQSDEITAHPHLEHRVQIQSLNFGKDAAKLGRVKNKARSAQSVAAQEGWGNGARYALKQGRMNGWQADGASMYFSTPEVQHPHHYNKPLCALKARQVEIGFHITETLTQVFLEKS